MNVEMRDGATICVVFSLLFIENPQQPDAPYLIRTRRQGQYHVRFVQRPE